MQYQIYDITGDYATDAESGQQLHDLIHPQLLAGHPVTLDFTGVKVFAS
ncbi:MAG: STAS-like domain-containing protein, partial [Oculatellaceae cyanobacterium Prado106]|nr:STAS-like domain-containing protein [Oculatellaceae cyanobacterium Prado106]